MKTLRRLQLRQGQELSRTEQMHVSAGEWVHTATTYGMCRCTYAGRDTHNDILHGYTIGTNWGDVLLGTIEAVSGFAGAAAVTYGSFGVLGGIAVAGGIGSAVDGCNRVGSAWNHRERLDYLATYMLINERSKQHNFKGLSPL